MSLEIHAEDQYAVVPAEMTLDLLNASLPQNLQYQAPSLQMSLSDWILSGGVGLLAAAPVRRDVLGLTYSVAGVRVEAGGRVVKNVSGYDLVRAIVASDPALERKLVCETITVRLRPRILIVQRELECPADQLQSMLAEVTALGAMYGIAYRDAAHKWYVRGQWASEHYWGQVVTEPIAANTVLSDKHGIFPRLKPVRSEFEQRILNAF